MTTFAHVANARTTSAHAAITRARTFTVPQLQMRPLHVRGTTRTTTIAEAAFTRTTITHAAVTRTRTSLTTLADAAFTRATITRARTTHAAISRAASAHAPTHKCGAVSSSVWRPRRVSRGARLAVAIGGGTHGRRGSSGRAHSSGQGCAGLISFGLAGGLDPCSVPGRWSCRSAVIADDKHYAADTDLSRMLGGATPHLVLGADAIVASIEEKRRLRGLTGASAVDLESGAVARVASTYSIPFAVLRAICDPAGCALPSVALVALDARGGMLSGAFSPRSSPVLANCPPCSRSPPTPPRHGRRLSHASSGYAGSVLVAPAIRIASIMRSGGN